MLEYVHSFYNSIKFINSHLLTYNFDSCLYYNLQLIDHSQSTNRKISVGYLPTTPVFFIIKYKIITAINIETE